MGLSRNKVAVSEGAAGSPPFYGESGIRKMGASSESTCRDVRSKVIGAVINVEQSVTQITAFRGDERDPSSLLFCFQGSYDP